LGGLKPGWRRVKFGDVVRLSKARCTDPLREGYERFVGLEHLEPGDLRIRRWGNIADGVTFTSVFKPGQVLFGKRRAYQRKVAVADFTGVCSGDIYVLESQDASVLLPGLLPFICQTDAFFEHAVGTSAGSLSPRTNWTSLAGFEFELPPMGEQRKRPTAPPVKVGRDSATSRLSMGGCDGQERRAGSVLARACCRVAGEWGVAESVL
jgi:type I restriction enzyme S subunit